MSRSRTLLVKEAELADPRHQHTRIVTTMILSCLLLSLLAIGGMELTTMEVATRVPGHLQSAGGGDGGGEHTRQVHVLVSGVLRHVHAVQGNRVRQGICVAELEDEEINCEIAAKQLDQARLEAEIDSLTLAKPLNRKHFKANRSQLVAELAAAEKVYEAEEASRLSQLKTAEAEMDAAAKQLERLKPLAPSLVVTAKEFDEVELQHRKADLAAQLLRRSLPDGHLTVLHRKLRTLRRAFKLEDAEREREIQGLDKQSQAVGIALDDLRRLQERLVVNAPLDGIVTRVTTNPGDHVRPGPIGIWIAPRGFVFEAQVPNRSAPEIQEGQPARIRLDAVDRRSRCVLQGKVHSIAPASTSKDANAGRISVYVVRIAVPDIQNQLGERLQHLRLGATGSVEIITGEKTALRLLLDKGIDLATRWD